MKEKEPLISLRNLLTIAFKHKYKILFSFVPILVVTLSIALTLPAHYVAKTVIMVKPGWEFRPTLDAALPDYRLPSISMETMINTELQILASHDLLDKVVNTVGAFQIYPDLQKAGLSQEQSQIVATGRILQDLLIKPVKSSNAIEILYRHGDPRIAATVANTLVGHLKDEHLKIFGETRSPLMDEQLKTSEARLGEAVGKLQAFKDKNRISGVRGSYSFLIGKRTDLESSLRIEASKLDELRKKIAFLKSQKKRVVSDLYTANVGSKLVDLEVKETQLLATYKENSRPVINIRKEIQKVKDALRQYEEDLNGSQEWTSLEAVVGPQEIKITGLRQQIAQLDKRLASFGYSAEELNRLERDVSVSRTDYETYLKKQEEVRISEEMDRKKATSIQIIETAAVPLSPVKTNQKRVAGLGLILAMAVSFGLTYLSEYVPQCITAPRGVTKHIRLPVLVSVAYKR